MLPLAQTTISITRPDQAADGYDPAPAAAVPIDEDVRAMITNKSGSVQLANGQRVAYSAVLNSDPADVKAGDIITDDTTGVAYRCLWAVLRPGFGIDHVEGRLQIVQGAS
jgi:hypothetical protein